MKKPIFLNPAYKQFTLAFNSNINGEAYQLEIIDIIGRTVYEAEGICEIDNYVITDLKDILAGQYTLKLTVGNQVKVAKLLIAK